MGGKNDYGSPTSERRPLELLSAHMRLSSTVNSVLGLNLLSLFPSGRHSHNAIVREFLPTQEFLTKNGDEGAARPCGWAGEHG